MARPQKPWYRKQTGCWMVEINGKQVKLLQAPNDAKHRQLAEEKFIELRKMTRHAPESATARVADLTEAFLQHSRIHFAPDTHRIYKYYCQLFAEACGLVLARDFKPFHVSKWVDPKVEAGEWGETTVYNARRVAIRIFAWAEQQGMLSLNPIKGMKNPRPRPRQMAITEAQYTKIIEYAGQPLRDILTALYHTGARPKEARDLTWDQVKDDRWVFEKHKTVKKTGKPRVVYLSQPIRDMMSRLRGNGSTHVFLNTEGKPWTMNALRLQVARLRKKLDLPKEICPYLFRHGFGTRAILSGVDTVTLAHLMGHESQEMIQKVYVHLAEEHTHLQAAVDRINAASTPSSIDQGSTRKRAKPVQANDG